MQKERQRYQFTPRRFSLNANYQKSVYSAVKTDVEEFLDKFKKLNTLNYADFANVWQEMNFTFVYADHNMLKPLNILCEVCFTTVKKYIMFQSSINIRIGAFYLLYGLYYKQPVKNLVRIRLTLEEYKQIRALMNEMLANGQYDALYVFAKMKTDGAFVFVAHNDPLSVVPRMVDPEMEIDDTFKMRGTESSLSKFENIMKDETVQALDATCKAYEEKLKMFAEENASGLVPFQTTIVSDLDKANKEVFLNEVNEIKENPYKKCVKTRAFKNKNAVYRGSKVVITALDLQGNDSD